MSINSAMLAGVSGLTANSVALSSISDNIANVNTVGYKQAKTDFESLVTSQASGSSFQSGGVLAVNRQLISQQGLQTQTQSDLDLSISGQGFFVTTDHATNVTAADTRSFTRAGSFTKDDQGYLRNAAGFYLQGWPVNAQGNITTDPSDLTKLQSINVSQVGGAADLTTQIGINANLTSGQTSYAGAQGVYDPGDMATGTITPHFESSLEVYDSLGEPRSIAFGFGAHTCVGQHLAKLELRTMFEQLIPRLESIDILGKGSVTHTNFVGGLKHLPAKVQVS